MKLRFAGVFLLAFAVVLTVWWAVDFARFYEAAVLEAARLLSPLVNGWWLDYGHPGGAAEAVFRSGDRHIKMLLQLPTLSMGIVPFIALVVATPGIGVRRAAVTGAAGVVLYWLIDVVVVLVYPMIMNQPNVFKDTMGVFSGLVAFVLAPPALWFVLTYPVLRPLWQLDGAAGRR